MANTYNAGTHTFALDTATTVAGLTTLKGSACAYTDHITGGDHLTVESALSVASVDVMPTMAGGSLTVGATATAIITLADAKASLAITDTTDDTLLARLISEADALFRERWGIPAVPAAVDTRTLPVDGTLVFLPFASAVTAVTDTDDAALAYHTVAGERSTDPLRWLTLDSPCCGHVKVTGTFGLAAYPAYCTGAMTECVRVWYKRVQVGGPGSENSYVGRFDAIPKACIDMMAPLASVRV